MLIPAHATERIVAIQPASVVGAPWAPEGIPRWPADLVAPARVLTAWQRGRGIAPPCARVRGLLAAGLGPWSARCLGAWAVVRGRAASSAVAWRKRLRARNDWR
jgi:hypothetical protein